jgi:hypothetical protein
MYIFCYCCKLNGMYVDAVVLCIFSKPVYGTGNRLCYVTVDAFFCFVFRGDYLNIA